MTPLASVKLAWPALAFVYLAVQPGWDYTRRWAGAWSGRAGMWAATLHGQSSGRHLATAGRLLYCLGVPYGALLLGIADARRLGLAGLPWWPQFPVGAAVGLASLALLAWSWGGIAEITFRRGSRRRLLLAEWQALRTAWGWVRFVEEAVFLQVSWAFVRGAAMQLLGPYAGAFAGLALVVASWLVRPGRVESLADPEARADALVTAGLALVTALVFVHAENLWLCVLVHGLGRLVTAAAAGRAYARPGV